MLTLFDFDESPNCLKTKILLFELGVPFTTQHMTRAELRGPEYRAKFPTGLAPAIEDGDLRISESGAIALYLGHQHGRLIPSDPRRRALMFQAMSIEGTLLAPTVGGQGLFGELYKPEAERNLPRIAELRSKAERVGHVLGELLGQQAFFAEELSLADIQLYAAVAKSLEAGVFGDAPASLVQWCERLTARPSVKTARQDYVHYRGARAASAA
jgi:glutathione S-transferase